MSTTVYDGVTYDLNNCTLSTCPLAIANVRYVPELGTNETYLGVLAAVLVLQLGLGIRFRTWGFLVGMVCGLLLEVIGYAGRIMMHHNQFIKNPFFMYLICLTIGPAFLSASIYLCLARIVNVYGAHLSRFQPRFYTITFIACDIVSLLLQAIGGAFAASSDSSEKLGEHIMLAGLSFQVVSLVLFSGLSLEFAWRVRRASRDDRNPAFAALRTLRRFKLFHYALGLATLMIIIRSSFRVAELRAGFGSSIANNQVLFNIFEGPMIMCAVWALTLLHPGIAFDGEWKPASWSFRAYKTKEASSMSSSISS